MRFRLQATDASHRLGGFCRDIECVNDEHAIEQARLLSHQHPVEVWSHDRFVARITPRNGRESWQNLRSVESNRIVAPRRFFRD